VVDCCIAVEVPEGEDEDLVFALVAVLESSVIPTSPTVATLSFTATRLPFLQLEA
jgi:hypothetical protein